MAKYDTKQKLQILLKALQQIIKHEDKIQDNHGNYIDSISVVVAKKAIAEVEKTP